MLCMCQDVHTLALTHTHTRASGNLSHRGVAAWASVNSYMHKIEHGTLRDHCSRSRSHWHTHTNTHTHTHTRVGKSVPEGCCCACVCETLTCTRSNMAICEIIARDVRDHCSRCCWFWLGSPHHTFFPISPNIYIYI